jgi:CO/xanthine dehydrogenase Mo-binding subunit
MQVSIEFASQHAKLRPYPHETKDLRAEVFTRRGGMHFGIAHLLDYPAPYSDVMLYRFADFNAGRYASRNAAFQQSVSLLTGVELSLDGDLLVPGQPLNAPGQTESAVRKLATQLGMDNAQIRRELELGDEPSFNHSALYMKVFEAAERKAGRRLSHAAMPRIKLESPKIKRRLTTEWFALRVDERWRRCMAKDAAKDG